MKLFLLYKRKRLFTLWIIFFLFFFTVSITNCNYNNEEERYPRPIFSDTIGIGQIAYYSFNSNTFDESGHGFDLQAHGEPTFVQDRFGKEQKAIFLDGVNDYLTAFIGKRDSLSISMWVMPYALNSSATTIDYGTKAIYANVDGISGASMLQYKVGLCVDTLKKISATQAQQYFLWHHIYIDGGSKLSQAKIYVNGSFMGKTSRAQKLNPQLDLLIIGRISNATNIQSSYYKGLIDDIRIFNTILTEEQIKQLYLSEKPTK